jgi:hypothetical protein
LVSLIPCAFKAKDEKKKRQTKIKIFILKHF